MLPLAISSGAGAGSRHSIGTGVVGGMLFATFVATFFIPLFYVWIVQRFGEERRIRRDETGAAAVNEAAQPAQEPGHA